MKLLRSAGLLVPEWPKEEAASDAAMARLVAEADGFLRAGGALSLADWADLLPVERAAFVAAGDALAAGRSALAGAAAHGPGPAAEVARAADGGAAARRVAVEAAAARAVERVEVVA